MKIYTGTNTGVFLREYIKHYSIRQHKLIPKMGRGGLSVRFPKKVLILLGPLRLLLASENVSVKINSKLQ